MPVCLGYPTHEKFNLSIEIPEGYVVESLPAPVRISSEDKEIVYSLENQKEKTTITIPAHAIQTIVY